MEVNGKGQECSEIVIALVAAVGTDLTHFTTIIKEELELYEYSSEVIRISNDILNVLAPPTETLSRLKTIDHFMTCGNEYRAKTGNNAALAYSAIGEISKRRLIETGEEPKPIDKKAWIIRSLKHPDEISALRETYGNSLYVIGIHASKSKRHDALRNKLKDVESENLIDELIDRDADEGPANGHGQHTSDTFHLADFFIDSDQRMDKNKNDIERVIQLIFGYPFLTPTFDEYAMFMAFSASTRSADLSRQVGAVLSKDNNIISTGANDVPRSGGGLYWPYLDEQEFKIVDTKDGRDYMRGIDSNKSVTNEIINDIISKLGIESNDETKALLKKTKLNDITEYGRIVHAEMEALLSCGRSNNSTLNSTLYCTTFPCHNCAKHIIAAGVERVVYVEPYSKSRAIAFHNDSITEGEKVQDFVSFEPFVGVGPRSFLNMFSMSLGDGSQMKRKDSLGKAIQWTRESARLRLAPDAIQYINQEMVAAGIADALRKKYS
jgi:deoxycytidylate deaminase